MGFPHSALHLFLRVFLIHHLRLGRLAFHARLLFPPRMVMPRIPRFDWSLVPILCGPNLFNFAIKLLRVAELLFGVARHRQTLALHVFQKLIFPHVKDVRLWNEKGGIGPSVHCKLGVPLLAHALQSQYFKAVTDEFLVKFHNQALHGMWRIYNTWRGFCGECGVDRRRNPNTPVAG